MEIVVLLADYMMYLYTYAGSKWLPAALYDICVSVVYMLDSFRLSTFQHFSFSRNSVRTGKARVGHVNLSQ